MGERDERRLRRKVRSPAKINLSLEVLGTRPDGYHEIRSVVQAVSLFDEIEFAQAEGEEVTLTCSHPSLAVDATNLIVRAARLVQQRYRVRQGAAVSLVKRIPVGGGLGGGSSNGAVALLAFIELWSLNARRGEVAELAAELGSDVSFFLSGGTALCEGRGERVTPVPCPRAMDYVLVTPPCFTSTAEVYGELPDTLTPSADRSKNVLRALEGGDAKLLGRSLCNDLQDTALALHGDLQETWGQLQDCRELCDAKGLQLSGSGSSFFMLTHGEREAVRAADYVSSRLGVACAVVHSVAAWAERLDRLTVGRAYL